MSLTLFAQNLLKAAAVTAPVVDLSPLSRLFDGDAGPQYTPGFPQAWAPMSDIFPLPLAMGAITPAQLDIDIDLGSAQAVSAWALVNHTITGVTVTLFGDSFTPPTTSRDFFAATGVNMLRTFATQTLRYWRLRIPAMAVAPSIGEAMLGVQQTIVQDPALDSSGRVIVGNVVRGRTPYGIPRKTKKGPARIRLAYVWNYLDTPTDEAALEAVFALADEGAKNLLVQDAIGRLLWAEITDTEMAPVPILGHVKNRARLTLEEVPL